MNVEDLRVIKAQYNNDPGECLTEMIMLWLKSIDPPPTWEALYNALKADPVNEAGKASMCTCIMGVGSKFQGAVTSIDTVQTPSKCSQPVRPPK